MKEETRITDAIEILDLLRPELRELSDVIFARKRRARQLRKARAARALTQADLARKTGISLATISRIERSATTQPTSDTLRKLAKALHLDPVTLLPH